MIKKASFLALVSCAVFSASCYAAGQYAQALGDCIYDNLSREDKNVMTQWAFVTLGKTDAAKQITVIPESHPFPEAPVGEIKDHSLYFYTKSVSGSYGKDPRHSAVCAGRKK